MTGPTIRLQSGEVIDRCKQHLAWYIEHNAYRDYDCLGAPARNRRDRLTPRQFRAIKRMNSRAPADFSREWCDRLLSELQDIPDDLDLIDDAYSKVYRGIVAVRELVRQMAAIDGVGDVAPTKALHLLRPRLVALSDDYVRGCLRIDSECGTADEYARRAEAVQRETRKLGQKNAAALAALHTYVNSLPSVTVPLSKVRVLDMVLWSHVYREERHAQERGWPPLGPPRPISHYNR